MRFTQYKLSPQRLTDTLYSWLASELNRLFNISYTNAQSLGAIAKVISTNTINSLPYYQTQQFIFKTALTGTVTVLGDFTPSAFLVFYTKGSGNLKIGTQTFAYADNTVITLFCESTKPLTLIKL